MLLVCVFTLLFLCSESMRGDEEAKGSPHCSGHRGRYAGQGELAVYSIHHHLILQLLLLEECVYVQD